MSSPGEILKSAREAQGKSIEELSEATGIRLDFLTALEQDAFDAIPGRGFAKLYIRAYAEVLGFDPRAVIDAYDRAQNARQGAPSPPSTPSAPRPIEAAIERWRKERLAAGPAAAEPEDIDDVEEAAEVEPEVGETAEVTEPAAITHESLFPVDTWAPREAEPVEPERVEVEPEPEPEPRHEPEDEPKPIAPGVATASRTVPRTAPKRWLYLAAGVVVLAIAVVVLLRSGPGPSPPPVESKPEPAPAPPLLPPPAAPSLPLPAEPAREVSPTVEPPGETSTTAGTSRLTVTESGIGDRDRFAPGERVRFTTRVVGGRAGEDIRHVWMRDGKVEQTIRLRLGGSSWRTHSTKTVGRPGAWVVEARDDAGRVLARAEFTCR